MWDQKEWWRVFPESYSCESPALNSQWPCSLPFAGRHSAGGENSLILRSRDRQEEPGSFQSLLMESPKSSWAPALSPGHRNLTVNLLWDPSQHPSKFSHLHWKRLRLTHGWRFFTVLDCPFLIYVTDVLKYLGPSCLFKNNCSITELHHTQLITVPQNVKVGETLGVIWSDCQSKKRKLNLGKWSHFLFKIKVSLCHNFLKLDLLYPFQWVLSIIQLYFEEFIEA